MRSRGNEELTPAIGLDDAVSASIPAVVTTNEDSITVGTTNQSKNVRPAPFVVNAASKIQAGISNNNATINPVKAPEAPKGSFNTGGRGGRNISIVNNSNNVTTMQGVTNNSIKSNTSNQKIVTSNNISNNPTISNVQASPSSSNPNTKKVLFSNNIPNNVNNSFIKPTPPLIKPVQ